MPYQYKREPLTPDEANRLASACETHQERLIVWTLLDTGLRVAELAGLTREHREGVMPSLTAGMKSEYQTLFDSCLIRPERLAAVNSTAASIAANKPRYQTVGEPLGVAWYVVGLIHAMEASLNFATHLHNGDPLTDRTTHVPPGRPQTGRPPFTWEESATDALTMQGLPKWSSQENVDILSLARISKEYLCATVNCDEALVPIL